MSRTWLITGSSRGFGLELARAALKAGDKVVATARRPEQLNELVAEHGAAVRTFALDVTDPAAAREAVAFAIREFGGLDVVVNNAGYANSAPIEDMPEDDFRAQVAANFFGVVNVTRAALPVFREQRSGYFMQFSSVGGRVGGSPGLGAYQAAKFAVEGFSEVLTNEVKPLGIRVTIVEPGAFRTDWQGASMERASVRPEYDASVGEMHRLRDASDGKQPGDPVRGAGILVDLVNLETPPLRLLLGADAVEAVRRSDQIRGAEVEEWAEVSRSAAFPVS
ncbi:oxidoreductase [Kibdelosporangium persicum]|uniref:NADP-dependent 3-hydroxy acid dehydrogenase YdfG n=1 Tax=Kibdelosporangium persicum TaxID=2698649 RepID=A0ABX2FC41_9PSEU|nr:oxidoreductase [Kibdelosporangium persicum]NRN68778.1 NADP-dependent 3-hydroxy acid dehydrogenase YdfG [Kibdelosporangium persicum]